MSCFNVGNTPKQITTPASRYQGVTAGNWTMPRRPSVTNIYVQNNYNGNYRNWSYNAWANIGCEDQNNGGFWNKVGNFLSDLNQGISIGSSVVGIFGDLFGIGKK